MKRRRAPSSGQAGRPRGSKRGRLAPGELDKLVLGYMRRHKKDAPHTASAVAAPEERSIPFAVANCLGRQEKKEKVGLVKSKPREYELAQSKKG